MKCWHDRLTVHFERGCDARRWRRRLPYVRDFPIPDGEVGRLSTAISLPIVAVDAPARSTTRYSSSSRLNRFVRADLLRSVN
jgi:hypothetical protein